MWIKQFLILVLSFVAIQCETYKFPDDFLIGSYQIEGNWNENGKGENNGDVGADSYYKFLADVKAMKDVGFHHYRFSVSWSRIIPNISMTVNQKGLDYYSRLIDDLLSNKIEPIITLYHWDLPQYLQDLGGFADPMIVNHFENYADVLYKAFGDRVKKWITFNEPWNFCVDGYGTGKVPPQVVSNGVGEYLCSHYMLQSHAAAYHLYKNKYFSVQKGLVGITLIVDGYLPKNRSLMENEDTQKAQEFRMGWYAHPIFSKEGGYPQVMIDVIGNNSMKEGRNTSRLPTMSDEMKTSLRGSADFFGLNYYTTRLVEKATTQKGVSWENDVGLDFTIDSTWKRGKSQGLHDVIVWIKNNYNNHLQS
ncbi:unnamed protein product [Diamesa hyperborea]